MYLNETMRGAYNKIKHAGTYIRHPEMLIPEEGKIVDYNEHVHIMLSDKCSRPGTFARIPVVGQSGSRAAKRYQKNIHTIAKRNRAMAQFVCYCLQNNLMRSSVG